MTSGQSSGRLAQFVLRLYPRQFRAEFEGEIVSFIERRRKEARFRSGWRGTVLLVLHLLVDAARTLPLLHARELTARVTRAPVRFSTREDRMDTLLQDLRYAVRGLARRPGFTITVLLTLMLGIGANTAIFSIVNTVLLRPLPYPNADRMVAIWGSNATEKRTLIAIPDLEDMRIRSRDFVEIGIVRGQSVNLTGTDAPDRVGGEFITAGYFQALGVHPALGRLFTPDETKIGQEIRVTVLSYGIWQSRFGGDAGILGKTLILNGRGHTVIGVTAQGFADPFGDTDIWLPITSAPSPDWFRRGATTVWAVGLLRPGRGITQGQRELSGIATQLAAEYPTTNASTGVVVSDLQTALVGETGPVLLMILAAVGAVLLIACANVANLQLGRASARQREFSIRASMGASRSRLVRQLLTESLMLSLIGGGAGAVLASLTMHSLVAAIPGGLPAVSPARPDLAVLLFSLAISIVTGVIFGAAPALHAARTSLADALRTRNGDRSRRGWFDARDLFVTLQLALCIVLLIGAGLLSQSLMARQRVAPGFAADHLLTAEYRLPSVKYRDSTQVIDFSTRVLAAIRAVPGVRSAALMQGVPMSGNFGTTNYLVLGEPLPAPGAAPMALSNVVTDRAFATMQIPLIEGRDFTPDDRAGSPPVVIINQEFKRRHWPNSSPLGKQISFLGPPEIVATVIGVVGDVRQRDLVEPMLPQVYQPFAQAPNIFNSVIARTVGDPVAMTAALRAAIWSVDRDQPVWKIRAEQSLLQRDMAPARFTLLLTGGFALLALLLAVVGVYGVTSFAVAQRTREVGIRMALGARKQQVVRLIVFRGVRVVGIAITAGTATWFWAARLVEKMLFGVKPIDPATVVGVPLILGVVAVLACWLPARRASRVDPAIALRAE